MAIYSRPGVYVEESLNPLSNITSDPSESVAAFVGTSAGGGPVGPTLINSWSQFQSLFGGIGNNTDDLSYATYLFFSNGGGSTYIVRALNTNATAATLAVNGSDAAATLTLSARAAGIWSSDAASNSRIFVSTQPTSLAGVNRFDLTVEIGSGAFLASRESFVDLSMDPNDPRYAVDVINSPVVGSKFVSVVDNGVVNAPITAARNPAAVTKAPLTGGSEGTGSPDVVAAAQRLDQVDRNLVINVPGASATSITSIATWVVASGRHFLVVDVPKPTTGEAAAASVTSQTGFADAVPNTSHIAVYGPWQYAVDPGSRAGSLRLTAPGGAVVGQFLRTDASRGVFKAPAGITTTLIGIVQPYLDYTNAQQDTLNNASVNVIKSVPGSGVCIMGSRTQGVGYPDRYVPVRRTLISLKSSLVAVSRFALFENNDESLWATVEDVIGNYLLSQYDLGAFKGSSPVDAFYVTCDRSNNSPADADAGVVNIEVGVALKNPAEFIVIRLGQAVAGANATDSLEENI